MKSLNLMKQLEENRKYINKNILIYGLLGATVLTIIFYFSQIVGFFILSFLVIFNNFRILENKMNSTEYYKDTMQQIDNKCSN